MDIGQSVFRLADFLFFAAQSIDANLHMAFYTIIAP